MCQIFWIRFCDPETLFLFYYFWNLTLKLETFIWQIKRFFKNMSCKLNGTCELIFNPFSKWFHKWVQNVLDNVFKRRFLDLNLIFGIWLWVKWPIFQRTWIGYCYFHNLMVNTLLNQIVWIFDIFWKAKTQVLEWILVE